VSVDYGTAPSGRWSAADTVAGVLAVISIFASCLGMIYRPVRIIPFAIIVALIAARMSERQQRLVGWAIAAAVIGWTVGMTIAIATKNPIF
jgi:hypothetical protein